MKKAAKITITALSAAAACGAAIYGVTHVLMDVAMNRQPPRLRKKKGGTSRLTGETPNEGFRAAQKEASRQLAAAPHEVVAIRAGTACIWQATGSPARTPSGSSLPSTAGTPRGIGTLP